MRRTLGVSAPASSFASQTKRAPILPGAYPKNALHGHLAAHRSCCTTGPAPAAQARSAVSRKACELVVIEALGSVGGTDARCSRSVPFLRIARTTSGRAVPSSSASSPGTAPYRRFGASLSAAGISRLTRKKVRHPPADALHVIDA